MWKPGISIYRDGEYVALSPMEARTVVAGSVFIFLGVALALVLGRISLRRGIVAHRNSNPILYWGCLSVLVVMGLFLFSLGYARL